MLRFLGILEKDAPAPALRSGNYEMNFKWL